MSAFYQQILRILKIAPAQQQAYITLALRPFLGTHQQACMLAYIGQVGIQCIDEFLKILLEAAVVVEVDPVMAIDGRVHVLLIVLRGHAIDNRHNALVVFISVINLVVADFGQGRIRTDDKNEGICRLDTRLNLAPPVRCQRDIFPIDPDITIFLGQRVVQAADEGFVFAGIRNKNFWHNAHPVFIG